MSDPIADILYEHVLKAIRYVQDNRSDNPNKLALAANELASMHQNDAKQIRQQIGRELLEALKEVSNQVDITSAYGEGNCDGIGIDAAEIVEKICQLEEDNEKG